MRVSGVDVGGHSKILRIGCEMQVPVHAAFFQVPQQSRLDWDDSAPPKTIPSKFWGVSLRTSLVLQCFCAPAPQVRGVKSSPSKHWGVWVFQGMGTPRLSLHETRHPDSPNLLHELLSIDSLGCSSPRIKLKHLQICPRTQTSTFTKPSPWETIGGTTPFFLCRDSNRLCQGRSD